MKLLIIIGIIAFITVSVWYAKRHGVTADYRPKEKPTKISTNPDNPVDFGYKIVWIAVKSDNKAGIANVLKLKNGQPSNWKSGIERAYESGVFITPQIGKWTLAVGMGLPQGDDLKSIEKLEKLLNQLSTAFGEAQFLGTHRVVEYHCWMKSVNGKIERIYAYIGESGENIKVFGKSTAPEEGLNLFNSLSAEAQSESYWNRDDLDYADEELVMKIAESWSVNPTTLTARNDVKSGLGLFGDQ